MSIVFNAQGKTPTEMFARIQMVGQHLNIAVLQATAVTIRQNFADYDAASLHWLHDLLASLDGNAPAEEFDSFATLNTVASYHSAHGLALPGYRLGHDSSGLPVWRRVTDEDTITADDRYNYLRHVLMVQLAQTTAQTLAGLATNEATTMDRAAVQYLPALADILIYLDLQNENEDLPFLQRPNPSINIFGDTSYDAIKKRALDANRQIAI